MPYGCMYGTISLGYESTIFRHSFEIKKNWIFEKFFFKPKFLKKKILSFLLKIWSSVCSKGRQIQNKGSPTIKSKFCVEIGHFGKISYFSRSDTICAPTRHTKRLLDPKIPQKTRFFQARACCVQALEKHPKRPKWTPWVLSFPTLTSIRLLNPKIFRFCSF